MPDKPIIAVITGGSAIALQDVLEMADAVLFAWYPGEQGGKALADILFGSVNPSGKLPITFYQSIDDLPPFDDYSMEGRTYKFFKGEPLFSFGYGLSYTSFEYRSLKTDRQQCSHSEIIEITVEVQNTGRMAGDEVVMVFASEEENPSVKHLIGFKRITLQPGETLEIRLEAGLRDMYRWDGMQQAYHVKPGKYLLQTARGLSTEIFVNPDQ